MDLEELKDLVTSLGQPAFRAAQVYGWLYNRKIESIADMSDLPANFRQALSENWEIGREVADKVDVSADGTKKYLFPAGPGKFIEAAYIPEEDRATLCLSTQVGCKMGCVFCATARQGFQGQVSAGRIVNQFLSLPERENITNIVYMGMGEPFDNPVEVLKSLKLFTDPKGIALGSKRITVSTVGLIPGMKDFLSQSDCHLAISIHSPFDEERRKLMPVQHVYPIKEVIETLKAYDWSGSRRLSFEYIMFDGVNDDEAHAKELVRLLNGLRCRVNLIHYHSIPHTQLRGSHDEKMDAFRDLLKAKGMICTVRRSRGMDIQAACGLLSTKTLVAQTAEDY